MLNKEELIELMRKAGFVQCGSIQEVDYAYDNVAFEYNRIVGKASEEAWNSFIRLASEQTSKEI